MDFSSSNNYYGNAFTSFVNCLKLEKLKETFECDR